MKSSFWLTLFVVVLISLSAAPYAFTQQQGVDGLSYQAFSGLATVYQQGGQSPELVAKLNQALALMDVANLRIMQGDQPGASSLQAQANSLLTNVLNQVPAAQQTAANQRTVKTLVIVSLVPAAVLLSTFLFYISLTAWRRYEKARLFEMRIIRVVSDEA